MSEEGGKATQVPSVANRGWAGLRDRLDSGRGKRGAKSRDGSRLVGWPGREMPLRGSLGEVGSTMMGLTERWMGRRWQQSDDVGGETPRLVPPPRAPRLWPGSLDLSPRKHAPLQHAALAAGRARSPSLIHNHIGSRCCPSFKTPFTTTNNSYIKLSVVLSLRQPSTRLNDPSRASSSVIRPTSARRWETRHVAVAHTKAALLSGFEEASLQMDATVASSW